MGQFTEAAIDVTKGGAGGGVSQLSMSTCNSTTGSLEKRISIELGRRHQLLRGHGHDSKVLLG